MSEPDEAMVEAAALALFAIDYPNTDWHDGISADMHEDFRGYARAVLSVPVVRDALARDTQVREIVAAHDGLVLDRAIGFGRLVALYPSPGDGWGVWGEDDIPARLISEEQR